VSSTGTFVSCKDYDDDIDRIDNTLNDLKSKLDALQTKVDAGKYVTNITKAGDGITITWNDNSTSTIETIKGDKGDKGDAVEISIDPTTKNWIIDGEDTGICAQGKDGSAANGVSAKSPSIDATTGNWVVYEWNADKQEYVGTDTGVSAKGASAYVVDEGNYYTLNVAADKAGTSYTTVKLPKSPAVITEIEVLGQAYPQKDGSMWLFPWETALGTGVGYSVTIVDDAIMNATVTKEWNKESGVKKLVKGQALSTLSNSDILIRVAPAALDASQFSFKMVNSQLGEAPLTLGTPEACNALLTLAPQTRATVSGNGLWTIPVSANEGETYKDLAAYKAKFTNVKNNANIVFALQEAGGFATNYNLSFYYSNVDMNATPEKLNGEALETGIPTTVNKGETLTITFDYPQYVYDAHLHIAEADIIRWGITDIDGTSFKVGKLADEITTTTFPVTVHYVTLNGIVKKSTHLIKPNKSFAGITTLANKNILIVAKDADNKTTAYDLAPMFADMTGNNATLWKADVNSSVTEVYYNDENGDKQVVSNGVTLTFNKTALKDITAGTVAIGATRLALKYQYYVETKFYDKAGNTLNTVIMPFTVSIPKLSEFLKKEQVVFGGTTTGKAYMNADDQASPYTADGVSRYAFHHAFNAFDKVFANNSTIEFAIDGSQKIGDKTIVGNYAKLINSTTKHVAIELTDADKKAYHTAINIKIKSAKYLGYYEYSETERNENAFALDVMSPIKEGSVNPATGTAISVVATAEGTAKLKESDFKAETYAGVAYHIFKDVKFVSGTATEYASKYIKTVGFTSANVNVFTVEAEGNAATTDGKVVTEGYVTITPKNAGYETTEKVNVKVTDIWGYELAAPVNVTVKPHIN
ncbi:PL29 family lyase N-terminal domain-containing protein, partial [Phocaeicola sartorii]